LAAIHQPNDVIWLFIIFIALRIAIFIALRIALRITVCTCILVLRALWRLVGRRKTSAFRAERWGENLQPTSYVRDLTAKIPR
jgi:hypothetical protein